jgi:hypothetical protein
MQLVSTPGRINTKYISDNGFYNLNAACIILVDKHHRCHEFRYATWTELENEVDVCNHSLIELSPS